MFPHAPAIGISETYGSTSIGSVRLSDEDDNSISLDFTKVRSDIPQRLAVIDSTYTKIIGLDSDQSSGNVQLGVDGSLDNAILKKSSHWLDDKNSKTPMLFDDNYKSLTSEAIYDPTISEVCRTFKLGSKTISVISTGTKKNILAFGMLDPKWKGWQMANGRKILTNRSNFEQATFEQRCFEEDEYEDEFQMSKEMSVGSPTLRWVRSLTLSSQILQVETYDLNPNTSTSSRIILVRTYNSVYILKFQILKSIFRVAKIFNFVQGSKWASFSHSSLWVSPEVVKLVIVDAVGKFIVFKSENNKRLEFAKIDLKYESYYEPTELSNFKKTIWVNSNRLLLLSRSQLHEYKFVDNYNDDTIDLNDRILKKEKLICRICAGTWSKLLDIVPSLQISSKFYLLTTKEIIIVDTIGGFHRKFAWKHYFNDLDTSMRLTNLKTPGNIDNEICIISSRQIGINYTIEFDIKNIKIVNMPYLFFTTEHQPVISMDIYRFSERSYLHLVLQKLQNNEISVCLMKYTSFFGNQGKYGNFPKRNKNPVYQSFNKSYSSETGLIPSLNPEVSITIYEKISTYYMFDERSSPISTEVTRDIYDRLKGFMENNDNSYKSLFQLIEKIHIPRNIKNIFKIVKHLKKNDISEEFNVVLNTNTWISDKTVGICKVNNDLEDKTASIVDFFESISDNKNKINTSDLILYLLLSLTGLEKTEKQLNRDEIEDQLVNSIEKLPEDYGEILNSFEDDCNILGIMDKEDINELFRQQSTDPIMSLPAISVSQAPQISVSQKSTQSQSKKRSKSKVLSQSRSQITESQSTTVSNSQDFSQQPRLMSQKISQISTNGFSQSQSKGSQRKKRRTGF